MTADAIAPRAQRDAMTERSAYDQGHAHGLKAARRVTAGQMDRSEFISACAMVPALPLTDGEPAMGCGFFAGLYAGLIEARGRSRP